MSADATGGAILRCAGVGKQYPLPRRSLLGRRGSMWAVRGVDLTVRGGAAVGIVGESGAGKSTLMKMLVGAEVPSEGSIVFDGEDVWKSGPRGILEFRRAVQLVFQNPRRSFDPRMTMEVALQQPLRGLRCDTSEKDRLTEVLDQVGLPTTVLGRYAHEFSGGQLQRLAIARALMPNPRVLVADEPVSALDVSVQARILNLLSSLRRELGLSLVMVTHDLAVVAHATDWTIVLDDGLIVDQGRPNQLLTESDVPATRKLAEAVLTVSGALEGDVIGD